MDPLITSLLADVRAFIEEERDVRVDSYTTGGDRSTLDPGEAKLVHEADDLLARIDAALGLVANLQAGPAA